jgi:drug/metabolite transporter (DMT)-like permease
LKKSIQGIFLALSAAIGWGMISPIAKILSSMGINLMTVMIFRSIFTIFVVGQYIIFVKKEKPFYCLKKDIFIFYVISGILSVAFAGGGFLMSLAYLTVPEALVIHYTFPLFTILGSYFITRESPTCLQVVAGVLIIVGVYIGMGGTQNNGLSITGIIWGIVSVIGMSGQSLVVRRFSLNHQLDEYNLLFYSNFTGVIVLILFKTMYFGWCDLKIISYFSLFLMTFQALISSVLAYGAFFIALKYISAVMVSLFCAFEIVVGILLTAIILKIIPTYPEIIGSLIIICAISCISITSKK